MANEFSSPTFAMLKSKVAPTAELITETTESWLESNVDPDTGYVLDRTLTMENAAAPADMVGGLQTAFSELAKEKESLFSYKLNPTWVTGSVLKYADGTLISQTGGAYTEDYYETVKGDTFATNLYTGSAGSNGAVACFYDANFEFISAVQGGGGGAIWKITTPNNDAIRFVRFSTRYYQDTSVFKYGDAFIQKYSKSKTIFEQISGENIDYLNSMFSYDYDLVWATGKLLSKTTGYPVANTNGAYTDDYLPVRAGDVIETNVKGSGVGAIVYYDAYYQFVSAVEKSTYTTAQITVPDDNTIAYARFCAERYNDTAYYSQNVYVRHIGAKTEYNSLNTENAIRNIIQYSKSVDGENKVFIEKEFSLASTDYSAVLATVSNDADSLVMACSEATDDPKHSIYLDFTSNPIDLSRASIGIDLDILEGTEGSADYYTGISEIDLLLSSADSYSSDSNVARFNIITNAQYILYPGNYKLSTCLDIQRTGSNVNVDLSAVKYIGIRVVVVKDETTQTYLATPSIKINELVAFGINQRKQIVIGFDGNYKAQLDAAAYLDKLGLQGTFFIANSLLTNNSDRMGLSDLKSLQDRGHLIANYCAGSGYWYNLTLAQKKSAIASNAAWLYAHGFGAGAEYISVPGGGYAADEQELYTQNYAKVITGRIIPAATAKPSSFYDGIPYGHSVGPNGTNETRFAVIESMIKTGGVCVFIFHRCNGSSDDITLDTFKAFADYIKRKQDEGVLEVVTADKLKTDYTKSYSVS